MPPRKDVDPNKPKKTLNRKMVATKTDPFYSQPYTVLERESLNKFEPADNSNKFYIAEVHTNNSGEFRYFANHGRVGTKGAPKAEPHYILADAQRAFRSKVREKVNKGYKRVDLATVTAGSDQGQKKINEDGVRGILDTSKLANKATSLPKPVADFVTQLYDEANQAVSLSLTGSVKTDIKAPIGNLGINGINRGRQILNEIARGLRTTHISMIERASIEYYNTIPRKLPSNLRVDTSWVLNSMERISREMEILDLYEDTLRMLPIMGLSDIDSKYMALNCDIRFVDDKETMEYILHKVATTHASNHNYRLKVKNAFEVNMKNAPPLNSAVGNVRRLFHGSRSANLVGILSSYLKLPNSLGSNVVKTGAMFGPGIYFASECTKSYNYSSGSWAGRANKYPTAFLMICEVALGEVYKVNAPHHFLNPPNGYHSVMGVKGLHLINNEFIVYRPDQVRVRYLVECEKN